MSLPKISTRIWSSKITCRITLEPNDYINENNNVFYILIPRNTYPYLYLPEIMQFFQIPESKTNLCWLKYTNTDNYLDWLTPLDILYTLDTHPNVSEFNLILSLNSSPIRMKPFQHNIKTFDSIKPFLEKQWRNSIKQSCFLINGSANNVMSMSMQQSKNFWSSVVDRDNRLFENIFMKTISNSFKNIPIKIYFENQVFLSPLQSDNLNQFTLADLLSENLNFKPNSVFAIAHGIKLPMDAPIVELYTIMKHIDGFLHMFVAKVNA